MIFYHVYTDQTKLDNNYEKLESFKVLKSCTDQYTGLDSTMITSQILSAMEYNRYLYLWLKINVCLFLADIIFLIALKVSQMIHDWRIEQNRQNDPNRAELDLIEMNLREPLA